MPTNLTVIVTFSRMLWRGSGLSYSPRGSNASGQWRVAHALHHRLTQGVHFGRIVTAKRRRNRWSVVHPTLQFELSDNLVAVAFGATLRYLVAPNVGFVQIVHKIHCEFNEEIAFGLQMIGVVQPVVKIRLRTKP